MKIFLNDGLFKGGQMVKKFTIVNLPKNKTHEQNTLFDYSEF